MPRYRINADFETIGGFWKPESPEQVFTGTLSSEKGLLKVLGSPILQEPDHERARQALHSLFGTGQLPDSVTLNGFTTAGRCTLLGTYALHDAGLTDYESQKEIAAKQYEVLRAVMGLHINSSKEEAITAGAFYLNKIHHWLPTPWGIQLNSDRRVYTAPFEALEVFRFTSIALRAEVVCEVRSEGSAKMKKGASILSVSRIRINPETPRSTDWFNSLAFRLENFFTLLIGTSVAVKSIQLFQSDDDGWLVHKLRQPQNREKIDLAAWVRCPHHKVSETLANWLAVPEDKRPVERTLLGMMRKTTMFPETIFLSLAQALEGFHRLRFPNMAKVHYANRIEQTYDLLGAAFATKLLGDRSIITRQIVETRNYFTHLGMRRGSAVVDGGKDLFLLNQRLHAFLRSIMLLDLGFAESELEEAILHQATKWR